MDQIFQVITSNNDSEYSMNLTRINSFIKKYTNGSKFAFLLNYGLIQQGKSSFSTKISGVKHKIGNQIQAETKGAIISYCGTIQNLINRFEIKVEIIADNNMHIFNIDTEGLSNDTNLSFIKNLSCLFQISSVVIVYGRSFTDSSIVPYIDALYHLANLKIIITLKNSNEIIDENEKSIYYYLDKAKSSDLWKKLLQNKIKAEIIPCTDFRGINIKEISIKMNKYLISRIIELISYKHWNDIYEFANCLKNIGQPKYDEIVQSVFYHDDPSDSIIKIIKEDCLLRINQKLEKIDSKDISIYDKLTQDTQNHFDEMCLRFKIDRDKYIDQFKDIINYIKITKINAQLTLNQFNEKEKILLEEKSKLDKEKDLVYFLSIKIYEISNTFVLNMMGFIFINDSSSLKMMETQFLIKCNNLISTTTPYIRNEMISYIDNDIHELSRIIRKNAIYAAKLIEKKEKERNDLIKNILMKGSALVASIFFAAIGKIGISKLICSLCNISNIPFKMTNEPNENNFVLKIGKKTFEASYDNLNSFLSEICETFGDKTKELFEILVNEIELSQIELHPVDFEPRDYPDYLEKLIQKEKAEF